MLTLICQYIQDSGVVHCIRSRSKANVHKQHIYTPTEARKNEK